MASDHATFLTVCHVYALTHTLRSSSAEMLVVQQFPEIKRGSSFFFLSFWNIAKLKILGKQT